MRVTRLEAVVAFSLDDSIVLTCGPALKKLQSSLGGRIHSINAPGGAPAELPRALLRLNDAIVNVGLNRFQVSLAPPDHIAESFVEVLTFARQRSRQVLSELVESGVEYQWSGLIVELNYPSMDDNKPRGTELAEPLFDRMLTLDRRGRELASFQVQFGFKDGTHFQTFTVSGYESRGGDVHASPSPSGVVTVNFDDLPIVESGIQILVDVNNKPAKLREHPLDDLEALFTKHGEIFARLPELLGLEELI